MKCIINFTLISLLICINLIHADSFDEIGDEIRTEGRDFKERITDAIHDTYDYVKDHITGTDAEAGEYIDEAKDRAAQLKDRTQRTGEEAGEEAHNIAGNVRDKASKAGDDAKQYASNVGTKAKQAASSVGDKASRVKNTAENYAEEAKDRIYDAGAKAKETTSSLSDKASHLGEYVEEAKEHAGHTKDDFAEGAEKIKHKSGSIAGSIKNKAEEYCIDNDCEKTKEEYEKKARDAAEYAREASADLKDDAKERAKSAANYVREKTENAYDTVSDAKKRGSNVISHEAENLGETLDVNDSGSDGYVSGMAEKVKAAGSAAAKAAKRAFDTASATFTDTRCEMTNIHNRIPTNESARFRDQTDEPQFYSSEQSAPNKSPVDVCINAAHDVAEKLRRMTYNVSAGIVRIAKTDGGDNDDTNVLPSKETIAERTGADSTEYYFGGEAGRAQALAEQLSGRSHDIEGKTLQERARDTAQTARHMVDDTSQSAHQIIDDTSNGKDTSLQQEYYFGGEAERTRTLAEQLAGNSNTGESLQDRAHEVAKTARESIAGAADSVNAEFESTQ